jgi:ATP-dependent DNA ligase
MFLGRTVNAGQELVIGGYTPSPKHFDALVIGYYDGPNLTYAARSRNGFTPALRGICSKNSGRWKSRNARSRTFRRREPGAGLTAAKIAECRWLKPLLVAQFEFVNWTEDLHLRHSRFMALRDDKKAKDVRREGCAI